MFLNGVRKALRERKLHRNLGLEFDSSPLEDLRLETPLPHRIGGRLDQLGITAGHDDVLHETVGSHAELSLPPDPQCAVAWLVSGYSGWTRFNT